MTRKAILLAAILLATAAPAFGQTKTLHGYGHEPVVAIWRDAKAREAGDNMLRAGINHTDPGLMLPLVACIVDNGTHVIVSDAGFFSSDVIVVDGPYKGCRGNVANDRLSK
jgi:hypothetical protein